MTTPLVCTEDGVCRLDDAPQQSTSSSQSVVADGDEKTTTTIDQEPLNDTTVASTKNNINRDIEGEDNSKEESSVDQKGKASIDPKKKQKQNQKKSSIIPKLHSQQDLEQKLQSRRGGGNGDDDDGFPPPPLLVEFVTTWCGACKSIQPLYDELAVNNTNSMECSQVICDKNKETKKLAAAYTVRSYPVFILFDDEGEQVDRWEGADRGKLEKAFEFRSGGSGGGRGGGGKKKKGKGGKRR